MNQPVQLELQAPARRRPELAWVCDQVLLRWLGLRWRFADPPAPTDTLTLSVVDGGKSLGRVVWPDVFFRHADAHWLQPHSLPRPPLARWPLADATLARRIGEPSLAQWFGDGRHDCAADEVRLPIDISGSVFFMLSRYEEAVHGAARDGHGRYPGHASLAQRAGLLQRPLVDEWVELLWWALSRLAPGLQRRARHASTWVSADVDAPFAPAGYGLHQALRQTASHLVNDRSARLAARALAHGVASRFGVQRFDAFDTFDWMFEVNARAGQRITFFFLALQQPASRDALYTLDQPRIAALLRRMVERGHAVGLHGSYASVDDADLQSAELDRLRRAALHAGAAADAVVGGRQHYLRWRPEHSARQLDALGLHWDATLGYADAPGFRCGTSHRFAMFDLAGRRTLRLLQRPLVLMEASVTAAAYLGLGHGDAAAALMHGLRARCRRFDGEFSLLWHNSNLAEPAARALYVSLLDA